MPPAQAGLDLHPRTHEEAARALRPEQPLVAGEGQQVDPHRLHVASARARRTAAASTSTSAPCACAARPASRRSSTVPEHVGRMGNDEQPRRTAARARQVSSSARSIVEVRRRVQHPLLDARAGEPRRRGGGRRCGRRPSAPPRRRGGARRGARRSARRWRWGRRRCVRGRPSSRRGRPARAGSAARSAPRPAPAGAPSAPASPRPRAGSGRPPRSPPPAGRAEVAA